MEKGKLYLIPSPLGENDPAEVIPGPVLESLQGFKTFVVEEVRTARRYLSRAGLKGHIGELQFFELNEHTEQAVIEGYLRLFDGGFGVIDCAVGNIYLLFERDIGVEKCDERTDEQSCFTYRSKP